MFNERRADSLMGTPRCLLIKIKKKEKNKPSSGIAIFYTRKKGQLNFIGSE